MDKQELLEHIQQAAKEGWTELDLAGQNISELPPEIGQLQTLKTLNLFNNQLTRLPSEIGELRNLIKLLLHSNQINTLPVEIGELQNLTELTLANNRLSALAPEMRNLKKLIRLNLEKNHLTELPPEIIKLQNLKELNLTKNQLSTLPSEIGELKNLTKLLLGANRISAVPKEIGKLQKLLYFELHYNHITVLPPEILNLNLAFSWADCTDEGELSLIGNPLVLPPPTIIQQGQQNLITYFSALEKNTKHKPVSELKIVVIGDEKAGKTSLIRSLLGAKFTEDDLEMPGTRIYSYQKTLEDRNINLRVWDFSAEDIKHHVPKIFMSKRSIYIVVLDQRKEDNPEYWLEDIMRFGGSSPILVVLNKIDEHPLFDVNRLNLRRAYQKYTEYPGILNFYHVSCLDNSGVEELRKDLDTLLVKAEMPVTIWPQSWFDIKSKIDTLKTPVISYERYIEICQEYEIDDIESELLIDFLKDLGVILYFADLYLPVILDMYWLIDAINMILNNDFIIENKGLIQIDSLPEKFPNHRKYRSDQLRNIGNLMKKFKLQNLVYTHDKILFPNYLPSIKEDFIFDYDNALGFIFSYDWFHISIILNFIIESHMYIKDNLVWLNGIVLTDINYNADALIQSNSEERRIYIFITGNNRRSFFDKIYTIFKDIHSNKYDLDQLNVLELVPLPGYPDVTVEYNELIGYEQSNRSMIFIGKLNKLFYVQELLTGIHRLSGEFVLEKLTGLIPSQFKDICVKFNYNIQPYLSENKSQTETGIDLVRMADGCNRLHELMDIIDRVKFGD